LLTQAEVNEFSRLERLEPNSEKECGSVLQRERIAVVAERALAAFPGHCLEIGCLTGGTSRILAPIAAKYGRKFYAVDYWPSGTPYDMVEYRRCFFENVKPWMDSVVVIEGDAHDPEIIKRYASNPLAFAFNDDNHDFESHLTELKAVLPVATGIVCVDDCWLSEVRDAVAAGLELFPKWKVLYGDGLRECWLVKA
jgi:SAM-dependent methyltransferase